MNRPLSLRRDSGERYGMAFGLGFLCLMVILLPLLVIDKGYFIYYGDFNSQQLPFYAHANDVVRSGGLFGWDWGTDLGSSFLGSYAFYLSGSPFFWLTVLLPERWVLYAIPWLLSLKHGIASLTAYCYIRRFVENRNAALIGGLLYAFSGFQLFNLFFNHFQDVTAFFPLLLIAMEELVNNNRRGWFALCTALMAIINYFFFTGQVVFCILYFIVRLRCRDFRIDWKKFAALAMEAVIGVCIAAVVLMPAALAILANERVSSSFTGQGFVFYSDKTRILRIIQSFFMIPDNPARPNLFGTDYGKWASIGGYLPLFSMTGVIAFMSSRKKHWATGLIWICILCAFVPVLNSAFYMLNSSYYARWFYMPILIMAMMTAYALDNKEMRWKPGLIACLGMLIAFGLISLLPTKGDDGNTVFFQFAERPSIFWLELAICLLFWLGTYLLALKRREGRNCLQSALFMTIAACLICTGTVVCYGKLDRTTSGNYRDQAIHGSEHLHISYETDDAGFFRVDMSENYDNYPMFWGLSSMRCFQSVVDPSIMEFYDSIGITRDVASRADTSYYTLRGLFSVKYYFDKVKDDMPELKLPGFTFLREENGFRIYQNDYYIPMGFPYDYYVTPQEMKGKTDLAKSSMLIHALVLDEEQAERYHDIITKADGSVPSEEEYLLECQKHAGEACGNFRYDSKGFSAEITLDTPKLVFFSVPYSSGWTAEVNGEPVDVEKVSNGFMAVRCESGQNTISFCYALPGLRYGAVISIGGLVLLGLYLMLAKRLFLPVCGRRTHSYDYVPSAGIRAAHAYTHYLKRHTDKEKGEDHNGTSV